MRYAWQRLDPTNYAGRSARSRDAQDCAKGRSAMETSWRTGTPNRVRRAIVGSLPKPARLAVSGSREPPFASFLGLFGFGRQNGHSEACVTAAANVARSTGRRSDDDAAMLAFAVCAMRAVVSKPARLACVAVVSMLPLAATAGAQSIDAARNAFAEGRFIEAARLAEALDTSEGFALAARSVTIQAYYISRGTTRRMPCSNVPYGFGTERRSDPTRAIRKPISNRHMSWAGTHRRSA